jgi:hypothetical protein
MCPGFDGVSWTSCHGQRLVERHILDWGAHPDGAVSPLSVSEDLEVFEDRGGELDAGPPALPV